MQKFICWPFCWPKENAKQRRERKYRSILRKQAGDTDPYVTSKTYEHGFGNWDKNKKKCGASIGECLERLLACLQQNEKLVCLMQELITGNFKDGHHSDLDTSVREACPCQFDEEVEVDEGSVLPQVPEERVGYLLVEGPEGEKQFGALEPESAKCGFDQEVEIDESNVFFASPGREGGFTADST